MIEWRISKISEKVKKMKNLNKALIGLSVFFVLLMTVYAHGNERAARQQYIGGHMMAFDAEEMDEMHDVMVRYIDNPGLKEAMGSMHEGCEQLYENRKTTNNHMMGWL